MDAKARAAQVLADMKDKRDATNERPPVFVTSEERAVFRAIKREQAGNPKAIITRGYLRLEQILNTRNRYPFEVVENDGSQRPSEARLKRPDAFYVDKIAVAVGKRVAIATATYGGYDLHTWTNTLVFTNATEAAGIRTLLNSGRMRVEVDQVIYAAQLDTLGMRYVTPAQEGVLSAVGGPYLADGWEREKVWRGMTPTIRFNGGSTNLVELFVNESINAAAPLATDENVIALLCHGWYAANCGEYNAASRA